MAGVGQPKSGGRTKGTPNKTTAALKDMILQAAAAAHPQGAVAYLTEQAQKNPTAFLPLLGKVLPLQVDANHSGEVVGRIIWQPPE